MSSNAARWTRALRSSSRGRGLGLLLVGGLLSSLPVSAASTALVSPLGAAPYGLLPRAGAGELWVRGAMEAGAPRGASLLAIDARVGLPWRMGLRLTAPVVGEAGHLGVASPVLGVGTQAALPIADGWLAVLLVELEVRTPSLGVSPDVRPAGLDPASAFWSLGGNLGLSFISPTSGLVLRLSGGGGGAVQQVMGEVGLGLTDELFARAGVAKLLPGNWQGSAGLVYQPQWMPETTWTLYAAQPFSREPPLVGLAFGWSFDLGPTEARPEVQTFETEGDVAEVVRTSRASQLSMLAVPGKVTVVVFGAAWCPPCGPVMETVKALAAADDRVAVRHVDVDANPAFSEAQRVSVLPHVVVFAQDGAPIRSGALTPTEVRATLDEALARQTEPTR